MADSSIEWTDKTWNPVRGCDAVSPGCLNCYAAAIAARFSGPGESYEGLATRKPGQRPKWTGELKLVEDKLTDPLHWKKPQRIFVNSMSDLFHKDVPESFIDKVFAIMALSQSHTFQVLTKRPERMAAYLNAPYRRGAIADAAILQFEKYIWAKLSEEQVAGPEWPLPNVWLGTSVENQAAADERIPLLLQTLATVRFLSCEPLLGPVDLMRIVLRGNGEWPNSLSESLGDWIAPLSGAFTDSPRIDWVIIGGESGTGARPCDGAWIQSLVNQCKEAGVPAFVKQMGGFVYHSLSEPICEFDSEHTWACKARSWLGGISGGGQKYKQPEKAICIDANGRWCQMGRDFMRATAEGTYPVKAFEVVPLDDKKGGDPEEWPESLRVRQFPTARAA